MKRKTSLMGIAIVVVCGTGIGATSLAASAESPAPSISKSVIPTEQNIPERAPISVADYGVAILSDGQRAVDKVHHRFESASLSQTGLAERSTRFVGTESGVEYWLALDNEGLICLVAATDTIAASGCFTVDRFLHGGANVRFSTDELAVEAYAVSDAAANTLKDARVTRVGSNVFLVPGDLPEDIRKEYEASGSLLRVFPEAMNSGDVR